MFDLDVSAGQSTARNNTDFDESGMPSVCCIAGVVGGALLATAAVGAYTANKASKAQQRSAEQAIDSNERVAQMQIDAQNAMFDKQTALQQPFRDIGLNAQNKLIGMLNGRYANDFSMRDFQQDPGYAFRLQQGLKGLQSNAAARGGLISGNALKAATQYGQEMGSQEYQNAFNRYQTNRANQLQPWQSLAGVGQSATNALSQAAGQQGAGISSALGQMGAGNAQGYSDIGNARASGYVGATNALSGALGNYLNYNQGQGMINAMNNRNSGYNPSYSAGLGQSDYYSAFGG